MAIKQIQKGEAVNLVVQSPEIMMSFMFLFCLLLYGIICGRLNFGVYGFILLLSCVLFRIKGWYRFRGECIF